MSERAVFLAALDIVDSGSRRAYLDEACRGNDALRKRVEELLATAGRVGGFLTQPHLAGEPTLPPASEAAGQQIGPYKLMEQIGEGGFGLVFVAEQQEPVRRKVALKVIKPGMDSREVIARFEAERQALAMMDHPHIARVLDAGTTAAGRPYFVMELVRGVPITDYCDAHQLTPRERLALFVAVCQAVQHAHQKGVIHRDLKPTNILVAPHDGVPVVKVIDFGVAKALGQQLTEKTIYTRFAQMVGTPLYMSPEQAEINALDVDTRSDVYALGVLLYELLTGTTPFDRKRLHQAAYDEIRRIIREEEPPKPSTRISSLGQTLTDVSAKRKLDPSRLKAVVRGELDWIVMKCLEKDRSRRYETASSLARDVQRYLDDQPVEACPPSLSYRLSKVLRKHRAAVTTAIMVALLMLIATLASYWQAYRAALAEQRAAIESKVAWQARDAEAHERRRADEKTREALATSESLRQTLYASEMNLAQNAWESRQYAQVARLLDQQRPAPGQSDLRGFEWGYWQRKLQRGRLQSVEIPPLTTKSYFRPSTFCFSRGGTRLAAVLDYEDRSDASQEFGPLTVFDPTTGRELWPPLDPFPGRQVPRSLNMDRLVSLSSDGKWLAAAAGDRGGNWRDTDPTFNRISIRDGGTGREVRTLQSPGPIFDLVLSPDGKRLAVSYRDKPPPGQAAVQVGVIVWDITSGEVVQTLPVLQAYFGAMLWSPDGTRLWRDTCVSSGQNNSGGVNRLFQIVDATSGAEVWRREQALRNSYSLRAWSWSPDGKWVVLAHAGDGATKPNLQFWDSGTGQCAAILDLGFSSPIWTSTIDFSPDGRLLAVVSGAGEIYLWELAQLSLAAGATPVRVPEPNLTLQAAQEIHGLAFSADSQKLYSVAGDSIASWDATVREDEGLGPGPNPELFSISGNRAVAFSQDATKVVFNWTRAGVGDFCVWDLARNREVSRLTSDASLAPLFSPDGRLLAHRVRSPQEIVISDVQTGQEWRRIDADKVNATSSAGSFVFSPNSRQLATIYTPKQQIENPGPRRLVVWDLETEKLVASANLNQNGVLLSYSPDGTSLVVASPSLGTKERTLTFLDAGTGQEQRSISIPGTLTPLKIDFAGQVIIAAARSFGRSLVAFSRGDVVLLDLATGHERLRLRGHDGFDCYAVSVDGSRLVLGKHPPSNPGESDLSLWSLKSGRRLMTLKCPGFVQSLAFSSSGHQLAAAIAQSGIGYRKPFYVWDATPLPDAQQADGK